MQAETNHQFVEMNQRLSDINADMNAEIVDVRAEIRQFNQNHIEHLNRHH